jgi:hypothetical protein
MPLTEDQIDVEERKESGRGRAGREGATEAVELRDGLQEDYPWTYWERVGYNEYVAEHSA